MEITGKSRAITHQRTSPLCRSTQEHFEKPKHQQNKSKSVQIGQKSHPTLWSHWGHVRIVFACVWNLQGQNAFEHQRPRPEAFRRANLSLRIDAVSIPKQNEGRSRGNQRPSASQKDNKLSYRWTLRPLPAGLLLLRLFLIRIITQFHAQIVARPQFQDKSSINHQTFRTHPQQTLSKRLLSKRSQDQRRNGSVKVVKFESFTVIGWRSDDIQFGII